MGAPARAWRAVRVGRGGRAGGRTGRPALPCREGEPVGRGPRCGAVSRGPSTRGRRPRRQPARCGGRSREPGRVCPRGGPRPCSRTATSVAPGRRVPTGRRDPSGQFWLKPALRPVGARTATAPVIHRRHPAVGVAVRADHLSFRSGPPLGQGRRARGRRSRVPAAARGAQSPLLPDPGDRAGPVGRWRGITGHRLGHHHVRNTPGEGRQRRRHRGDRLRPRHRARRRRARQSGLSVLPRPTGSRAGGGRCRGC